MGYHRIPRAGVPLIHVSTDYVFDGTKGSPYVETDTPHPLGAYAVSKFAGELYAQAYLADPIIIRTSGVFGPGGMFTPQIEKFSAPDDPNYDLIMRTASPRGMMQPLDVANVIAFLASDAAAAIHGAVYRVDNGKGAG